jgi:uncharacterized protein
MVINVSELQLEADSELEVDFEYEPETIDLGPGTQLLEPVEVHLRLTRGTEQIWLYGQLEALVEFTCDRCLKKYEATVSTNYVEEYRNDAAREETEESGDEVRTVFYRGSTIDVAEGVRQNLLLSMPVKHLCDPACKGLCPTCGHDLNEGPCDCEVDDIDPRLEALKEFEFNESDEGSVT